MLRELNIENLALVEKLKLEFEPGLNLITGETGAGKSILLDALGLALGFKADASLVRSGAEAARVTALFDDKGLESWLEGKGLPQSGGELWLKRELLASGRGRAWINGESAPLASLAELGELLADFQSQHEHQSLLKPKHHRALLDEAGGLSREFQAARSAWSKYSAAKAALEGGVLSEEERLRKLDVLSYQVTELDEAGLKPGEKEALLAERNLGQSAGKRTESLARAQAVLSGGDQEGALSLLENALAELRWLKGIDASWAKEEERFRSALEEIKDLAALVEKSSEKNSFDPARAEAVESRLHVLEKMLRKYGGSEEAALAFLEQAKAEKEGLESHQAGREALEKAARVALEAWKKEAASLSQGRQRAAEVLQKGVAAGLAELGMPKAVFEVRFAPLEGGGPEGAESVEFMLCANPGEALRPLHKVASGGELSRITLALKASLAGAQGAPVIVFDEVDSGVSGRVAEIVGERIEKLAQGRQVLCVTHLPQIASRKAAHFRVEKKTEAGKTRVEVARLLGSSREEELAQMIAGREVTDTARSHARELLKRGGGR